MFYIEENKNINWFEKKLKLIKVIDNTMQIPSLKDMNEKEIEKIASKTCKTLKRFSNSNKIVISKQVKENIKYINLLNTYGMDISDGKWLFEILLTDITEYIIVKTKMEKINISILINDLNEIEIENIKILAKKYKNLNIVTNHIEKFKNICEQLEKQEGIIITITNNKKKSLMRSNIILNVDFPNELINKYRINENSVIVNVKGKILIKEKRFNGLNIHDYEIDFREDKKEEHFLSGEYMLKDIYESNLYKKQNFYNIRDVLKLDKVIIKKLKLNNSNL